jgi:hypothetical protein
MATKAYSMKKLNCKYLTPCIAAMLLCMACNKDPQIERVFFEFEMPFTITPGTDTVRVGDTLRMEANFSDTLFDALSQRKYDLDCFTFPAFMAVRELILPDKNFTYQNGATDAFFFSFEPNSGGVTSGNFANIDLSCKDGKYHFSLEVIPRRKGVFAIKLIGRTSDFIQLPQYLATSTVDVRKIPVVRINRYIINKGNTHFENFMRFAKEALPERNGNWPFFERYSTYTIIVI